VSPRSRLNSKARATKLLTTRCQGTLTSPRRYVQVQLETLYLQYGGRPRSSWPVSPFHGPLAWSQLGMTRWLSAPRTLLSVTLCLSWRFSEADEKGLHALLQSNLPFGLLHADLSVEHVVVECCHGNASPCLLRWLAEVRGGAGAGLTPLPGDRRRGGLAVRQNPEALKALLGGVSSQQEDVREATVRALAVRQEPRVLETLLDCLADQDHDVRDAAMWALAGRHEPRATEALLDCLASSDEFARSGAAEALAVRQEPGVTEALLGCLADTSRIVRLRAVEALSDRQEPEVTDALLNLLTGPDPDSDFLSNAVEALGKRESPEGLLNPARNVHALSQRSISAVTEVAEALTVRHYCMINAADQPEVLAAMQWLTTDARRPFRRELDSQGSVDEAAPAMLDDD